MDVNFKLLYSIKFLVVCLALLSWKSLAEKTKIDFRGFIDIKSLNIGDNIKFNNFVIKGVWDDTKGNYGKAHCSGSWLSDVNETRKKDMIYCEFEDQNEQKFWKKVERKGSEQKAGIGKTIIVEATSNYKKSIGKECIYAINYTKDAFIMILNCNY